MTQSLIGKKHGQSLEAFGHEFYGSIAKRTFKPSAKISKKNHGQTRGSTCKQRHACLYLVSVHQMAPPLIVAQTSNFILLLIYRPRKDERLSWPSWLTYSGRFTNVSGHPSAVGHMQNRERLSVKDQRSTAVPHNQPYGIAVARKIALNNCSIYNFISPNMT